MDSGRATLEPGRWQDVLEFDGRVLSAVHGPRWRLVLIGAGQLTRYLAEMAHMLDYHVTVVDPREEYATGWDVARRAARPRHARRRGARAATSTATARWSR